MPDTGLIIHRTRTSPTGLGALLTAVLDSVWCMEEPTLGRLYDVVMRHEVGIRVAPEDVKAIVEARSQGPGRGDGGERGYTLVRSVAVIPIGGVIAKHASQVNGSSQPTGTATETVRQALANALADDSVRSILLHIESPGGTISGVETLAAEVAAARDAAAAKGGGGKPIWTFFDDIGASAAYWIGSQANRVLAGSTADVGSIGVYSIIPDTSKHYEQRGIKMHLVRFGDSKGVAAPGVPIDEKALAVIQQRIDDAGEAFIAAVVRGRSMTEAQVRALATGNVWMGVKAVEIGLVDEIAASADVVAARMHRQFGGGGMGGVVSGARGQLVLTAAVSKGTSRAEIVQSVDETLAGAVAAAADAGIPAEDNVRVSAILAAAGAALCLSPDAGVTGGGTATPAGNAGGGGGGGSATVDPAVAARIREEATNAEVARVAAIDARARPFASNKAIMDLATKAKGDKTYTPEKFGDDAMQLMAPPVTGHQPDDANGGGLSVQITEEERDKRLAITTNAVLSQYAGDLRLMIDGSDPETDKGRGQRIAESLGYESPVKARMAFRAADGSHIRGMRMAAIAEDMAMRAHRFTSREQLVRRFGRGTMPFEAAVMAAAMHSSSDFPILLGNLMNMRLAAGLVEAQAIWREFAIKGSQLNYHDQKTVWLSEAPNMEQIPEGQTPGAMTLNEKAATINVSPFGKRGAFTFQTFANDQMNAFLRVPQLLAQAHSRTPDILLFTLLNMNNGEGPIMPDGQRLFSDAHSNKLVGTVIDDTNINLAYIAMTSQKGMGKDKDLTDDKRPVIEVFPTRMLVHNTQFMTARQWHLNQYKPGGSSNDLNLVQNLLKPTGSVRVGGAKRWYPFADPAQHPVFQVNFFAGNEGLVMTEINDGDPLSWKFQVTSFGVGAAAVDHYGASFNPGPNP